MSDTNLVIVDDRDPSVVREGQWASLGVYQEYLTTTSSSGTQGSTLTLKFTGTAIQVHGTIGFGDSTSLSFAIDGGSPSTFTSTVQTVPQFHQTFFTSTSSLADGDHTLVITQANSITPTSNTNLFVDYFLVAPGSATADATSEVDGKVVFIDDADPGVTYAGSWANLGTEQDLQSTLHAAATQGGNATFSFDGTSIDIYGAYLNTTALSTALGSVAIDGGTPTTISFPAKAPAFQIGKFSNQLLFKTAGLAAGPHTVVLSADAAGLTFDYATVTAEDATVGTASGTLSGSSTSASSTSPTSAPSTSAPSTSAPPPTSVAQSTTTSVVVVNPSTSANSTTNTSSGFTNVASSGHMLAGWIALYAILARLLF